MEGWSRLSLGVPGGSGCPPGLLAPRPHIPPFPDTQASSGAQDPHADSCPGNNVGGSESSGAQWSREGGGWGQQRSPPPTPELRQPHWEHRPSPELEGQTPIQTPIQTPSKGSTRPPRSPCPFKTPWVWAERGYRSGSSRLPLSSPPNWEPGYPTHLTFSTTRPPKPPASAIVPASPRAPQGRSLSGAAGLRPCPPGPQTLARGSPDPAARPRSNRRPAGRSRPSGPQPLRPPSRPLPGASAALPPPPRPRRSYREKRGALGRAGPGRAGRAGAQLATRPGCRKCQKTDPTAGAEGGSAGRRRGGRAEGRRARRPQNPGGIAVRSRRASDPRPCRAAPSSPVPLWGSSPTPSPPRDGGADPPPEKGCWR